MSEENVWIKKKTKWITKKNSDDTSSTTNWIQKKDKVEDTPKEWIKRKEDKDKKYSEVVSKVKKKNIKPENIGEIILSQIPGVSTSTSLLLIFDLTVVNSKCLIRRKLSLLT